MISIEVIMIIANYCMSPTNLPKDIEQQKICTESITTCAKSHKRELTAQKFNQCVIQYEVERK